MNQYGLLFQISSGPPGVWGIWEEWLFIFRELGNAANYFQGFGELASSLFWGLREPCKKVLKSHLKEKAFILFDFLKKIFSFWGEAPQTPLRKSKCIYFRANMLIWSGIDD